MNISNELKLRSRQDTLLHHAFELRAIDAADRIAVCCASTRLTYADLNIRADRLAVYLTARGVAPDQLVGVCMERSIEMVVSLLGILKAGGAYVPLEPTYPPDRLTYMVEDARPRIVLTQQHLRDLLSGTDREVIALDSDWERVIRRDDGIPPRADGTTTDRDLAYVIHTSGSTGQPKGAMNEHRGVVNRIRWMQSEYPLGADDKVLQKTPFGFDVSVGEFFGTLSAGACLVLARPEGHKDPEYIRSVIDEESITRVHFVPSMLRTFLEWIKPGDCPSLRRILCSGEELSVTLQQKCHARLPHVKLTNLYGPTEAAIEVTAWECHPEQTCERVPIGAPISGVRIYILDDQRREAREGEPGEIFIGGIAVGRGYLNRPDLTAERFVEDPFSPDPHARMYRTGDVGRWREDGAIEYLGRNDHQVKIRGFRIEQGEIYGRLSQHPDVKDAVVVAREDHTGDRRLVAYVVPQSVADLEKPLGIPTSTSATTADELRPLHKLIPRLRKFLKASLPDYMLPSAFVALEAFPVTANGKLDRNALPAPEPSSYSREKHEPPRGHVEEAIAQSWQSALAVVGVGRQDNFFELGGNSLMLLRMMNELRERGLLVAIDSAFRHATLAELAGSVKELPTEAPLSISPGIPADCQGITPEMLPLVRLEPNQISGIVRRVRGGAANIQDIYPLTPLQEGILFHHLRSGGGSDPYVRVMMLALRSRQNVDNLISALQSAIARHEALRIGLLWKDVPVPVQVVHRQVTLPVDWLSSNGSGPATLATLEENVRAYARLDLSAAPLMRLAIARDGERNRWYAALITHHIVIDNESLQILFTELSRLLDRNERSLGSPGNYRDHVVQVLASLQRDDSEPFFRAKLEDVRESSAPFGLHDVHGDGQLTSSRRVGLGATLTTRAREQARRLRTSMATLFHAAWGLVVAHTAATDDVVFGSVLLGRFSGGANQQTVGMFLNTLPIRLRLQNATTSDLVRQAHRELADLLKYEHAPLVTAQRTSGIDPSLPLFTSILNYRHQPSDFSKRIGEHVEVLDLLDDERTNYPIVISVDEFPEELLLTVQTDQRIDSGRLAGYLRTAFEALVHGLASAPEHPANRLAVLSDADIAELLQFSVAYELAGAKESLRELPFECQPPRTSIYVLNSERSLVPVDVVGELYMGGAAVASGHVAASESLCRDTFSTDPDAQMYRTGISGRWRAGGKLEVLGGAAVAAGGADLGAIEAKIAQCEGVEAAAVLYRGDAAGGKRLVAYVTCSQNETGGRSSAGALRRQLGTMLPENMVPDAYVFLDDLPVTAQGELDRQRLPAPDSGSHVVRAYEAPLGAVERAIAEVWQAELQVERVGRRDSFFELGGHSLRAIMSLARLNQMFDTSLTINDLYRTPTVGELARCLKGNSLEDAHVDLVREAVLGPEVTGGGLVRVAGTSNVLLTGATGFVGRFLLAQLLRDTAGVVYCLVRARSPREGLLRIRSTLERWDLWRDSFENRIVAMPGDLGVPGLGMDAPSYRELGERVDCIYHVATRMNHLETYAMCKHANVDGTRELLRIASQGRLKTVNYVSTLSVFSASKDTVPRVVSERTSIEHERHSIFDGYAASKWVGERLVLIAAERGIPVNVFRVGLVWADSQAGRYDELQREYRVFKTCLLSGLGIDGYRYEMPPTPVDYVASALVQLAIRHRDGGGIFHISSPAGEVDVFRRCNQIAATSLDILSYERWISEIGRLHRAGLALPAVPLIQEMFAMDVEAIALRLRESRLASENLKIDCTRTRRELESLGVWAPVLTDELLSVFLAGMFKYDERLRSRHSVSVADSFSTSV